MHLMVVLAFAEQAVSDCTSCTPHTATQATHCAGVALQLSSAVMKPSADSIEGMIKTWRQQSMSSSEDFASKDMKHELFR